MNSQQQESEFSSSGHRVDLFAPGEVCGASAESGSHTWNTGTSFSAPLVCGLALQYLEKDLNARYLKDEIVKAANYRAVSLRNPESAVHASPMARLPPSKDEP